VKLAARAIRLLVLDVDGVLTDGRLYFGARGEALKVFHVRDGHGIVALRRAGVDTLRFSTGEAYAQTLQHFFETRRGRRRG